MEEWVEERVLNARPKTPAPTTSIEDGGGRGEESAMMLFVTCNADARDR